jgi:hypothetical protein
MRTRIGAVVCLILFFSLTFFTAGYAQQPPDGDRTLKVEGAKLPPVTFSHKTHVDKVKVECATCHHKDAKEPKACVTCHDAKDVKDKAPIAKDAFHKTCQTCHKEKGGKAPTKCTECHKK